MSRPFIDIFFDALKDIRGKHWTSDQYGLSFLSNLDKENLNNVYNHLFHNAKMPKRNRYGHYMPATPYEKNKWNSYAALRSQSLGKYSQSTSTRVAPTPVQQRLAQTKGERTKELRLALRKAARSASRSSAIKRFFDSKMPILDMRTYPAENFSITSGSAEQKVWGGFDTNYILCNKSWCYTLLNKMHLDMAQNASNTPGDGQIVNSYFLNVQSANIKKQGLSLLKQTRTYEFMNTVNAVAWLEFYEYVYKGLDDQTIVSGCNPKDLWEQDLNGDNPVWDTNVTSTSFRPDRNLLITEPGVRPSHSKKTMLSKHWKLERKTKYCMPGGTRISHTVSLPAMYLSPDEITPTQGLGISGANDCIPGKTRAFMIIIHGQMGFEGAAEGETELHRMEYLPCAINVRWRQHTKVRVQEHGMKSYIHYTGCHDFTSDVNEHHPLTKPVLLVMDPENLVYVADRDTNTAEGADPGSG